MRCHGSLELNESITITINMRRWHWLLKTRIILIENVVYNRHLRLSHDQTIAEPATHHPTSPHHFPSRLHKQSDCNVCICGPKWCRIHLCCVLCHAGVGHPPLCCTFVLPHFNNGSLNTKSELTCLNIANDFDIWSVGLVGFLSAPHQNINFCFASDLFGWVKHHARGCQFWFCLSSQHSPFSFFLCFSPQPSAWRLKWPS